MSRSRAVRPASVQYRAIMYTDRLLKGVPGLISTHRPHALPFSATIGDPAPHPTWGAADGPG